MIQKNEKGINFQKNQYKIEIQILTETTVHIQVLHINSSSSESLIVEKSNFKPIKWDLEENEAFIKIFTEKICVEINLETGLINFLNNEGELILKEGNRTFTNAKICDEDVVSIQQDFKWVDGEAFYGLGQFQNGIMNWRGSKIELYQQNKVAVSPMLVSTNGYGILWDNYSYTIFNDTDEGSYIWSEVADGINYYFIYGPEIDQVIGGYRTLTGKAPMFGKWAFGYIQSKERYKTQKELLRIVKKYRDQNIPLDIIVQDWKYWKKGQWGQKSFDEQRFPVPQKMIRQLHDDYNVHIMISVWPSMDPSSPDYQEMAKNPGFLYRDDGKPDIYDAFNEKARKLYWEQAYNGLFSKGIDAWWCDATEPELENFFRDQMKPSIGTGARYMNAYSLMQSKGIYEHQRSATSDKRVMNLTRSSFSGQQKYAAITWSGDIKASWRVFRRQITAGLNFCMSGIPYWTTDIGAFFTKLYPGGCKNNNYKELYLRWFQWAVFCPLFRSHGTDTPREVWQFGEPGSLFFEALVKAIHLRYRLIPYIYSVAWMVTNKNYTMMRGLAFDFRGDLNVNEIKDQFMFGPSIMVNPVIKSKANKRKIYLPEPAQWYDFWTGKIYDSGQTIETLTPKDIIPLFIKAGSIIPMGPFIQYATEKNNPIELRIYTGYDSEFLLYEDENDNYNYEDGAYAIIPIRWNEKNQTLIIGNREGNFSGMLESRTFNITWVSESHGIGIKITKDSDQIVEYNGTEKIIKKC